MNQTKLPCLNKPIIPDHVDFFAISDIIQNLRWGCRFLAPYAKDLSKALTLISFDCASALQPRSPNPHQKIQACTEANLSAKVRLFFLKIARTVVFRL